MDKHDPDDKSDKEFMDLSDKILNEPNPPKKLKINSGPPNTTSTILTLTQEQKDEYLSRARLTEKENYFTPSKWIFIFNEIYKVKFIYKTDSVLKDGVACDMNNYKAFTRLTIKELSLAKHFNKQTVDDMITVWMSKEKATFLNEFRQQLSFAPSKVDHIRAWVKASTGKEDKLDIAVMRHFIWQVRRKLHGLEVSNHMMPILYGKTGGGKSQAVLKLLKPMNELMLSMDLSIFSDQFKTRLFNKAFVMFFDEMARSERADIDKLKNIITSPFVDFRGMHTENLESIPQNCTFIGCSNDLVYDKIYDPTSARRYWQVNCADKLDWKSINTIDYLALWRSVDENADCPVQSVLKEIQDVQEKTIRHKDLIEDWMNEFLSPKQYEPSEDPTSTSLYGSFKEYCKWQNINNVPTMSKFSRRVPQVIANLGWQVGPHRTNFGTVWAVSVKPAIDSTDSWNVVAAGRKELRSSNTPPKKMDTDLLDMADKIVDGKD